MQNKSTLRKLALAKRNALPEEERAEKSQIICALVHKFLLEEFRASSTIALYEAINSEVNLSELALALSNSGAKVLKPIMSEVEGVMEFTNWENTFDPRERKSWQPSLLVNFGQFALRSSFDSGSRNTSALTFAQSLLARIASKFPSQENFYKPCEFELVKPEKIDIIVCPVVAFDSECNRLGYGGGYYDRYLPRMSPSALKLGVAFACQQVEEIPRDPHDIPLDCIVTE